MSFHPRPLGCINCPANSRGFGYVPAQLATRSLPAPAAILVLGSGPNELEAKRGEPFTETTPAGNLLTRWLYSASIQRSEVTLTHLVRCWLPKTLRNDSGSGQRAPTAPEIAYCRSQYLDPLLDELDFTDSEPEDRKVVVPLGPAATAAMLDDTKTDRHVGTQVWRDPQPQGA